MLGKKPRFIAEQNEHSSRLKVLWTRREPLWVRRWEGVRKGGVSSKSAEGKAPAIQSAKLNRQLMPKNCFGNIAPISALEPCVTCRAATLLLFIAPWRPLCGTTSAICRKITKGRESYFFFFDCEKHRNNKGQIACTFMPAFLLPIIVFSPYNALLSRLSHLEY